MGLLKPPPGVLQQPAHPLAQGLTACWLLNEGAGSITHDYAHALSAVGNPAPAWGPDRCDFNGADQVFLGDITIDLETDFTVVAKVCADPVSLEHAAVGIGDPTYGCRFVLGYFTSGRYRCLFREDDNSNIVNVYNSGDEFDDGRPHQIAFSFAKSIDTYYCVADATVVNSSAPWAYTAIHASKVSIGSAYYGGNLANYWPGSVYYVYIYRRALTPGEIIRLYHEPFAMFERPFALAAVGPTAGGVLELAGSVGAASACNASAEVIRALSGSIVATSTCTAMGRLNRRLGGSLSAGATISGSLSETGTVTLSGTIQALSTLAGSLQVTLVSPPPQAVPARETAWLTDALLNGATAQAFKLGTALTRGWFWVRREGCSAIYRGPGLDAVDFGDILDVAEPQAETFTVPTYLAHEPGSTYCYVVRRFNGCGHQELTTAAAVTVSIGLDGKLADPVPNEVFGLEAKPTDGNRIRLRWFYCPLDQKAAPEVFKVYGDGGTGQVDLNTVLATIAYEGRKFYSHHTDVLAVGRYTLVVRAEGLAGAEGVTLATVCCPIAACNPEPATILAAEAIP
jgi:hypothetical protein